MTPIRWISVILLKYIQSLVTFVSATPSLQRHHQFAQYFCFKTKYLLDQDSLVRFRCSLSLELIGKYKHANKLNLVEILSAKTC